MSDLEKLCLEIDEVCTTALTDPLRVNGATGVSPSLIRKRANQLLELSKRLADSPDKARVVSVNRGKNCKDWADTLPGGQNYFGRVISFLFIIALTLPYYICTTYNSWFVDEGFAIYRNPDAKGETPVLEVLQHDFWGTSLNPPEGYTTHKSWRPLITLSYACEWRMAQRWGYQGQEMKPMRFFSCIVHTVNSILTLWLLYRLRVTQVFATVAAALFATHPIHIENIVYLVGRADSLSTTFYISGVLLYLCKTQGLQARLSLWTYACLVLVTALAGLCKEPGFTVLFFLACVEIVLRFRVHHVVGLLISFAALGGLRVWYVGGTDAGFGYVDTPIRYQEGKLLRTLSYLYQHAYYAKLLIFPWNQSWDYSFDALPMVRSLADVRLLAILAAYLGVVSFGAHGLRVCRTNPAVIFGLGLIVIPFVPASNLLFLVGTTVGERLLYPCTVGWAVLVAALLASSGKTRFLMYVRLLVAAGLLAVYIWNSNVRMSHWRNTRVLFETDAHHWGRSAKVLHSRASELQAKDDLEGALKYYLMSLEVFDDQAITDYCIARVLLNLDRHQEAYQRFDKILNGHGIGFHDGNDFLWMTDLGYTLVKLAAYEQGVHYLQEGLRRFPYSCYAWNALGVGQAHMSQLEKAVASLMDGLACDSQSAVLWNNLAVVYAYGNAWQQANEALQKAVTLNETNLVVAHNVHVLTGRAAPGTQPRFELYIPLPGRMR